jgi:hypothetical protein
VRHRGLIEGEERRIAPLEVGDGEIVRKIDRQQLGLTALAVGRDVFEPVRLRIERDLRDDVIVGYGEAIGGDEKTRACRGLPLGAGNERAKLQQPCRCGGIDALGSGGSWARPILSRCRQRSP